MKMTKPALTIAGSDPSGGAGIQADLKTFAAHEVPGVSVITSVTSQNSRGVQETYDLPVEVVAAQLNSVFSDSRPSAVKTGMLGNETLVECVADRLRRYRIRKIVVDPVIRSSSRKTLLSGKGVEALKSKLLPLALLVTPNLPEAEALSGLRIVTPADRIKAARAILKTGVKNVLIKGGHARGNADDLFYDGRHAVILESRRLARGNLHGTGCVFSAAIVAGLASGQDLPSAVRQAKKFISQAILQAGQAVQAGNGATNLEPLSSLYESRERLDLFQRVAAAVEVLRENKIGALIPEVQSNIGVGLRAASVEGDVIAFPARIVKKGRDILVPAPPEFGASKHVAHIVLTVMRFDPSKRAVMNLKYSGAILKICKRLKFKIASFSRSNEPRHVRTREGSSLEWGTAKAIRDYGKVPDIIYDLGGMGKEEMIRVIADDVESLVDKVLRINRAI
ncbi:MAG: bifunctional hydroxymethylpyrimidine kinase/phosphomethylpyrimidine kinase [Nitrospinales bacterium]